MSYIENKLNTNEPFTVQDGTINANYLNTNTINVQEIKIGNITIRDNNIDFGDHWGGIIMYYQRHAAAGVTCRKNIMICQQENFVNKLMII